MIDGLPLTCSHVCVTNLLQVSQCETSAKGGAKRNVSSISELSAADVPSSARQPLGPSQRGDSLGARRNSLALNGHSKPPFKRKAAGK
eukprot:scaffold189672_cov35-Prasinocladus_malaysianus.AAC.1